jgi:hypothetical protein
VSFRDDDITEYGLTNLGSVAVNLNSLGSRTLELCRFGPVRMSEFVMMWNHSEND